MFSALHHSEDTVPERACGVECTMRCVLLLEFGGPSCPEKLSRTFLLCLCAATVLSRNCCADFGRPLAKKVMSHSRDGLVFTAPLPKNIVPLTGVWNPPPSVAPL